MIQIHNRRTYFPYSYVYKKETKFQTRSYSSYPGHFPYHSGVGLLLQLNLTHKPVGQDRSHAELLPGAERFFDSSPMARHKAGAITLPTRRSKHLARVLPVCESQLLVLRGRDNSPTLFTGSREAYLRAICLRLVFRSVVMLRHVKKAASMCLMRH